MVLLVLERREGRGREEGMERERGGRERVSERDVGETSTGCLLYTPQVGTEPHPGYVP